MKKRILALTLILALLLLTSCDTVPVPTAPTGDPATAQSSTAAASSGGSTTRPSGGSLLMQLYTSFERTPPVPEEYMEYSCQYLPETVENPDNLPVLKWVFLGNSMSKMVANEEPVRELNQMLADRNMPFRIQIIYFSYYADRTPAGTEAYVDWFARADSLAALEDADLITANLTSDQITEYLMPITDHVTGDAQPTLKNAVPHELNWIKGSVGDEIYAINSAPYVPFFGGWVVRTEFMEKYSLTTEDFQKNFWEMDELFAQIYEKNGNQPFLYLSESSISATAWDNERLRSFLPGSLNMSLFELHHHIGATYIVDNSTGAPKVENILETQELRSIREAVMRYQKAGYGPDEGNPYFHEPPDVAYSSCPGISGRTYVNDYDYEMTVIQITPSVYSDVYSGRGYSNGVAAGSEHQEEAVALLNLITTDESFRNQLLYGKEGRDYTIEDGERKTLRQEDGTVYNFSNLSPYSDLSEFRSSSYPVYKGMTLLESYQYMLNNVDVIHMPMLFDYTGFEEELDAIENLYWAYFSNVSNPGKGEKGDSDYVPPFTNEDYEQLLQALKDAGGEKIQTELQRQLDEWLAENPDWQ